MPTKTPSIVRQQTGESLRDFMARAALYALEDDHHVILKAHLMECGAELRMTPGSDLEFRTKQNPGIPEGIPEHDQRYVLEAVTLAKTSGRSIRVFCSNNLELSVHIRPGLGREAALAAYRESYHVWDHHLDLA